MKWSLRNNFLLISAIASAAALLAAGSFLYFLFQHDLMARIHTEIHHHMMQLVDGLAVDGRGHVIAPRAMSDPRFDMPLGGLYWEVATRDGQSLASRSLWDSTLQPAAASWTEIEEPIVSEGPFGEPVLLHARLVNMGEGPAEQQLRVMIAMNEAEVREPLRHFLVRLALSLAALAFAMLLVTGTQLALVMSPINRLRHAVRDIRDGRKNRVAEGYPVEMEPIVTKLNDLLEQKEQNVETARARASNFAHSLKTPLTIIDTMVAELRHKGLGTLAADIGEQTGNIRQHVDRELARARLASGHGDPMPDVAAVVREVTHTIRQLPRGSGITFDIDVPAGQALHMDREDFIELLGNILDNARKWARSRTEIRLATAGANLHLSVSDDGPGIPDSALDGVAERGRRLDEATEGTGIGLAIVKEIVDAYRLTVSYGKSSLGGLDVTVTFPLR